MELSAAFTGLRAFIKNDRDAISRLRRACKIVAADRDIKQADEVFALIERCAIHACCKGRVAGYAHLAYRIAYMKAHYPASFSRSCKFNGNAVNLRARISVLMLVACVDG